MKVSFKNRNNRILNIAPTRIIVLSFLSIIIAGTFALALPIASNDGNSAGLLTALFTATSATCVTGLVVVDTLTQWTVFGQIVILTLIQAGGLGIVTFATFFSIMLGKKVGLKGMLLAQESLNHISFEGILKLIKRVVLITFTVELLGAVLLSIRFVPKFGLRGIYMGIFHSISAFCNAGFDIMGNFQSFTAYNNDPLVIYTIAGLVVIGGLGFLVWKDLYEFKENRSLLLHTKVVLSLTGILIAASTILFFVFEAGNPGTMGNFNFSGKINSAVFHSIATRTAGFNTLPVDQMTESSKVATILLMFIGAAPGSTAGGIKVTTFGVILIAILSQIKGSEEAVIFKRRIPHNTIDKALAIIGLAVMWVIVFTIVILAVEKGRTFINVLYEVTSAFGTVGLSAASTPTFGTVSRLILILTMFLGRIGPVTMAIALTLRANKSKPDMIYPEGKIVVG